jgi:hypothetical protein
LCADVSLKNHVLQLITPTIHNHNSLGQVMLVAKEILLQIAQDTGSIGLGLSLQTRHEESEV